MAAATARWVADPDWLIQKNHDTFGPIGPFIVPKEFMPQPMNMRHYFMLNGEIKQDSNTSRMEYNLLGDALLCVEHPDAEPGRHDRAGQSRRHEHRACRPALDEGWRRGFLHHRGHR